MARFVTFCNAKDCFLQCERSSIVCRKVTFYNVSDGEMFLRKYLHTVTLCINLLKISGLRCDSECLFIVMLLAKNQMAMTQNAG